MTVGDRVLIVLCGYDERGNKAPLFRPGWVLGHGRGYLGNPTLTIAPMGGIWLPHAESVSLTLDCEKWDGETVQEFTRCWAEWREIKIDELAS